MSNYEANPVGFLYERYQSSGNSPIYEVQLKRGQAHAPIFEAVLTVPEGDSVTAIGSSKKIAKNIAAKMMLDKLDSKKTEATNYPDSVTPGDGNNNLSKNSIPTLSASSAAAVGEFYRRLQKSHGVVLDKLTSGELCLAGDMTLTDFSPILEELGLEQNFAVKFLQLESVDDVEQSLVQILSEGLQPAVTVCLGMGPGSKNLAARCALMYIKNMAKSDVEQ